MFERLERYAGKLARTVLRGRDGGNTVLLPGGEGGNAFPLPDKVPQGTYRENTPRYGVQVSHSVGERLNDPLAPAIPKFL
jgi:hypothetical protein